MLAKKQAKVAYGTRDEIEAYIYWTEDPVDLRFVL